MAAQDEREPGVMDMGEGLLDPLHIYNPRLPLTLSRHPMSRKGFNLKSPIILRNRRVALLTLDPVPSI